VDNLAILRGFGRMYHQGLAKLLAAVLMLALVVKPCIGLLSQGAGAVNATGVVQAGPTAALSKAEDKSGVCKSKCLVSRQEEVVVGTLVSLAKASGQPGLMTPLALAWPHSLQLAGPVNTEQHIETRKRLAMLSRLLL
jgi:hypothetical protein